MEIADITQMYNRGFLKSVDQTTRTVYLECPVCTKRFGETVGLNIKLGVKLVGDNLKKFFDIHQECVDKFLIDPVIDAAFNKLPHDWRIKASRHNETC